MNVIVIKDINNNYVTIDSFVLLEKLRENNFIMLYGMDANCILELRNQYLVRGGKINIDVDSIRDVFSIEAI